MVVLSAIMYTDQIFCRYVSGCTFCVSCGSLILILYDLTAFNYIYHLNKRRLSTLMTRSIARQAGLSVISLKIPLNYYNRDLFLFRYDLGGRIQGGLRLRLQLKKCLWLMLQINTTWRPFCNNISTKQCI